MAPLPTLRRSGDRCGPDLPKVHISPASAGVVVSSMSLP